MTTDDFIREIKIDLGVDVVSLGIRDDTIRMKVQEALRKISAYAPRVVLGSFDTAPKITMPEGTTAVLQIMSGDIASDTTMVDNDVFGWTTIMMNSGTSMYDPYTILQSRQNVRTLQSFIKITDFQFDKDKCELYISGATQPKLVIKYMVPYRKVEEIKDELVMQKVKEYALALCKIIEGMIRRKLQNTPGAMQLDGDSLVSEGNAEKDKLDQELPRTFKYMRMGIRI